MMATFLWRLRGAARRLGATGFIGLALLAAALWVQFVPVQAGEQRVLAQRAELAALRAAAASPALPSAPLSPLAALPTAGSASQQIGELERLAQAHGLALPRGQYTTAPLAGTSLQRWQLVLPVTASYPALHAFLATALERLPNLTLDEFKLKRDRIESTELQADLRFSLFVEATP